MRTNHQMSLTDIRYINSLAVRCTDEGCDLMHWDAYHTGRCAHHTTDGEMQLAYNEGWCR